MRAINTKRDCYLYYAEEIRPLIAEMEAQNNEDYSELHNDIASLFDLLAIGEDNLQNDKIKKILLKVQLASLKMIIRGYARIVSDFDSRICPADLKFVDNGLFLAKYKRCKDEIAKYEQDILSTQKKHIKNGNQIEVLSQVVLLSPDLLEPYKDIAESYREIDKLISTHVEGYRWSEKRNRTFFSKWWGSAIQLTISIALTAVIIICKPVEKFKRYMESSKEHESSLKQE